MSRYDIILALIVVGLIVVLVFVGPSLLDAWRGEEPAGQAAPVEAPVEAEAEIPEAEIDPETAAQVERVNTMLMLYQACANRFEGFDERGRETLAAWRQRNADVLAIQGAEPDFHIVLRRPGGESDEAREKADAEELAMCERNLEVMRADLESAPQ